MSEFHPQYQRAESMAYSILVQMRISVLPVDLKAIVKGFPTPIIIKTYSKYAKLNDLSEEEVISDVGSNEGGTKYDPSKRHYLILINDRIGNRCRNRWTLAHELGHIALKHHESLHERNINWKNIPPDLYSTLELESNCFARCLLAPPNILHAAEIEDSINCIMQECDISYEAAAKIKVFFENGKTRVAYAKEGISITDMFADYIDQWKRGYICTKCGAQSYEKSDYCFICGEKFAQWRGINGMKYSSIELGPNNRAKECPICNNENIIGDHCQICGTYIVNRCLNFLPEDQVSPFDEVCGKYVPGDARFCPYCGHITSFAENKLLGMWTSEKKHQEELPFDL